MTLNSIGERLKLIRKKTGLTQKAFAEKANIGRTSYSNAELNLQQPSFSVLNSLQQHYNISIDWLLTGRGDLFIDKKTFSVESLFPDIQEEYIEMLTTIFNLPEKLRNQIFELWQHQLDLFLENVKSSPTRIVKR